LDSKIQLILSSSIQHRVDMDGLRLPHSATDRALDLVNVQLVDTTENEKRPGEIR
jgi:hypothetical protein